MKSLTSHLSSGTNPWRRLVLSAAGVALALATALVLSGCNAQSAEEKAEYDRVHSMHPVQLSIQADGLDAEGTTIPVQIKGTDVDGNEVDKLAFADHEGKGVELMQGDYTLTFVASPLSKEGAIYELPVRVDMKALLGPDMQAEEPYSVDEGALYLFTPLAFDKVDEQMINDAYQFALLDPANKDKAAPLKELATTEWKKADDKKKADEKKKAEDEKKKEEEEKAKEQQEEGATSAGTANGDTFSTAYYDFKIPSAWSGQVEFRRIDSGVAAVDKQTDVILCWVQVGDSVGDGDMKKPLVGSDKSSSGKYVALYQYRLPVLFWYTENEWGNTGSYGNLSDAQKERLLNLSTNGAVSLSQVRSIKSASELNSLISASDGYYRGTVSQNVLVK